MAGDLSHWQGSAKATAAVESDVDGLLKSLSAADIPSIDDSLTSVLEAKGVVEANADFLARWDSIRRSLWSAKDELGTANKVMKSIVDALEVHEKELRVRLDQDLAARGLDGARINQLQELTAQASLLESRHAHLDKQSIALSEAESEFDTLRQERSELVDQQRIAFDSVIEAVHSQFDGRIEARRIDEGRKGALDGFLRALNQRGITRWWNDLTDEERPTPDGLLTAIDCDQLEYLGMSSAVQKTFIDHLTPSIRRELEAIRCRDHYVLEFMMDDGRYRRLRDLSGGQGVNLLLSLLLETSDERPLVIDQPEDELDNRFLFETMLPALKRLKGRRQIIVATHNANIVVNGDADQVIQLEASATRGHIKCSGAIEEPAVRDAIVQTVDGGDKAFRLRRMKYGF